MKTSKRLLTPCPRISTSANIVAHTCVYHLGVDEGREGSGLCSGYIRHFFTFLTAAALPQFSFRRLPLLFMGVRELDVVGSTLLLVPFCFMMG